MAIYLPIVTQFNNKGVKDAEKSFADLEGAQAKATYAIQKSNKYATIAIGTLAAGLVSATKAAIEDSAAANLLGIALQKSAGATQNAVKANGEFIDGLMLSTNTADDVLRPAMARLSRSTGDVTKAQELLVLAVDISKGSGKSLETVTAALSKGFDGNTNALGKLGLGLDQGLIKSKDFGAIQEQLTKNFGGFGDAAGATTEGQLAKFTLGIAELKEGIGAALFPVLDAVLPLVNSFADWAQKNPEIFTIVGGAILGIAVAIKAINIAMALNPFGLIAIGIGVFIAALVIAYKKFEFFRDLIKIVVNNIASQFEFLANAFIAVINTIIKGINIIKPGKDIGTLGEVSIGRMGSSSAENNFTSAREFESANGLDKVGTSITPELAAAINAKAVPVKTFDELNPKMPGGTGGPLGMGFGDVQINVQAGLVSTGAQVGQDIIEAIQQAQRRSGTVFAPA